MSGAGPGPGRAAGVTADRWSTTSPRHGASMARHHPAVVPFVFVPPPPNVRRCLELAARVARLYGVEAAGGGVNPDAPVVVRARPAGPIGNLTVAFATVSGAEVAASEPRDGEMAALDDLERVLFGGV